MSVGFISLGVVFVVFSGLAFCVFFDLAILFLCCLLFLCWVQFFISTTPRWLGRLSQKWPILFRVGRKTL